ncbi:HupE/UreJ family protein [Jhaorihella thermophila]
MKRLATVAAIAALTATPALAHTGVGGTSGLVAGFVHPLMGGWITCWRW